MTNTNAADLYIQLLKRALSFALYDEPPVPAEHYWMKRGWTKQRVLLPILDGICRRTRAKLCFVQKPTEQEREGGRIWPVQAHSMIGVKRMDNLIACAQTVIRESIPGDFIETGVWRGGACILMRGILAAHNVTDRKVFVADSFAGLPKPDENSKAVDQRSKLYRYSYLAVSRKQVEQNFARYGLLDSQVEFLEGWFKDTLPKLSSQQLALIRLDGDMYSSTIEALQALYPKLSVGGFCIIDDFHLKGCRDAVADYREEHKITEHIEEIDGMGVFWRKVRA